MRSHSVSGDTWLARRAGWCSRISCECWIVSSAAIAGWASTRTAARGTRWNCVATNASLVREGSPFQQFRLVRLAFPLLGIRRRRLLLGDHRPVLGELRIE